MKPGFAGMFFFLSGTTAPLIGNKSIAFGVSGTP